MVFALLMMIRESPAKLLSFYLVKEQLANRTDPASMYGAAYGWPRQHYRTDPGPLANAAYRAIDYQPGIFQRGVMDGKNNTESDPAVCHIDSKPGHDGAAAHIDEELDYDNLLFVDEAGNFADGRTCDIIYEDENPDARVRIVVDEDGHVVDMAYADDTVDFGMEMPSEASEVPTTVVEAAYITATTVASPPSGASATMPASTTVSTTKMGSVVTLAPF